MTPAIWDFEGFRLGENYYVFHPLNWAWRAQGWYGEWHELTPGDSVTVTLVSARPFEMRWEPAVVGVQEFDMPGYLNFHQLYEGEIIAPAVPEPSSTALLGLGLAALLIRQHRRP